MQYQTLSKFKVAETQLFRAIDLYMKGDDLICAITLAGAAEEILGMLVRRAGGSSALDDKLDVLCRIYEAMFKAPADRKPFANLRNHARNELKHFATADYVEIDLEQEASRLLQRAVINYKKLGRGMDTQRVKTFHHLQRERVRRNRERWANHCCSVSN